MGERVTIQIFRGMSGPSFRTAWTTAVAKLGGGVQWDCAPDSPQSSFRSIQGDRVTTVLLYGGRFRLCSAFALANDLPWMELRIQEGSLWDYTLLHGDQVVDQFSTLPEYWDPDDTVTCDANRGDASLLTRLWDVPLERIERYLEPWGYRELDEGTFDTTRRGKAYPDDQHEYGDIWQMLDFLNALGGDYPHDLNDARQQHTLTLP